jgi:hypothetical protein
MTEQQLADLAARAAAATPGPWEARDQEGPSTLVHSVALKNCTVMHALYAWWQGLGEKEALANAAFVAAAREAVPALIAEVREAREVAREERWRAIDNDDDPEDWQKMAYRSGCPKWLEPPEWFLEKHPWMRQEEA